jgi:hypothetical protein
MIAGIVRLTSNGDKLVYLLQEPFPMGLPINYDERVGSIN